MAQVVKPLPAMQETWVWSPGRSPGEGNGNLLQYSCLENSMDGGTWWATVHGVAKSWTWVSSFTSVHFTLHISLISRVTVYSLDILLSQFWTSHLFTSGSICCFLTYIQVSQETGKVVWYSHFFLKNFLQCAFLETMWKIVGIIMNSMWQ